MSQSSHGQFANWKPQVTLTEQQALLLQGAVLLMMKRLRSLLDSPSTTSAVRQELRDQVNQLYRGTLFLTAHSTSSRGSRASFSKDFSESGDVMKKVDYGRGTLWTMMFSHALNATSQENRSFAQRAEDAAQIADAGLSEFEKRFGDIQPEEGSSAEGYYTKD